MKNRDDVGDSKPPSWPPERGTDPPVLMSYWPVEKTQGVEADARSARLADPFWESWYERAVDAGVDVELAALGSELMREAWAKRWDDTRAAASGWLDDGEAMLELACRDPDAAANRWRELLGR